jgi:hypothetical protein
MAFGLGSVTADAGAVRFVGLYIDLLELLPESSRERLAGQIKELNEARNELEIARAEAVKAEQAVAHRERQATKHQQELAAREQAVAEKEAEVRAAAQRLEQQRAEFAELRAQVRKNLAA